MGRSIRLWSQSNLIYMQATAMTESLYLALFIWAVVYFSEFIRSQRSSPEGTDELSPALQRGVRREEGSKSRRDDRILTGTALLRCAGCLAARNSRATTDGFWQERWERRS